MPEAGSHQSRTSMEAQATSRNSLANALEARAFSRNGRRRKALKVTKVSRCGAFSGVRCELKRRLRRARCLSRMFTMFALMDAQARSGDRASRTAGGATGSGAITAESMPISCPVGQGFFNGRDLVNLIDCHGNPDWTSDCRGRHIRSPPLPRTFDSAAERLLHVSCAGMLS